MNAYKKFWVTHLQWKTYENSSVSFDMLGTPSSSANDAMDMWDEASCDEICNGGQKWNRL